jgi:cytochrome c peroxidase
LILAAFIALSSARRLTWIALGAGLGAALALLLVPGSAWTQAADSTASTPNLPLAREPIAPIPAPPAADPRKLALGEHLFTDPRLSHDGTRACSSCHDTRTNGADGNRHDTSLGGTELALNTSTVFNAALSFRLGWEGRFRTLEAQAESSLENPEIMGNRADEELARLGEDPEVSSQFQEIYGHGVDRPSLLDAIATYERSLLTPDSRFDQWLRGNKDALTMQERHGYQLFKSLGCISCHQGVNVGGNLFERHGIYHPLASPLPELLRVPSLRNVATTPPYFHDGSASTLENAICKMGMAQLDQNLSDDQIGDIVAFLRSLTGSYQGHPVTAPSP